MSAPHRTPASSTTIAALLVLAGWLGVSGCVAATASPSPSQTEAMAETVLRIGESATPPGSTTVVTVANVTDDSRCPVDVTCVWAGDATVTLRVQPASGAAEDVALRLASPDARAATVAGLRIALERLEPARRSDQNIERDQYRVALAISR